MICALSFVITSNIYFTSVSIQFCYLKSFYTCKSNCISSTWYYSSTSPSNFELYCNNFIISVILVFSLVVRKFIPPFLSQVLCCNVFLVVAFATCHTTIQALNHFPLLCVFHLVLSDYLRWSMILAILNAFWPPLSSLPDAVWLWLSQMHFGPNCLINN